MIEQVLVNRGLKRENIEHFLNLSSADILDPATVNNLEEGVKLLLKHIKQNSLIYMPIDSDCDGFTSAALFVNYLNKLFPHFAQSNIIYKAHIGKEHGILTKNRVPNGVKLVVAIDSSSNEFEVHQNLVEAGIDVLVIDHHEAEKVSDYACVINNQLCDYPTKSLSGVGMAYKFCCYIDQLLGVNYAENYEDLVALGLIADMMDSRDFETQILIQRGLLNIRNPYFKEMVDRNARQFEGGITPINVAFYVAPFINAINRSGTYEEKILIFESMLEFRAYETIPSTKRGCKGQVETRVEQAGRTSVNVKNRQKRAETDGAEIIDKIIKENNLLEHKVLIVPIDAKLIEKNLAGLIANQLASKYQRPVMVLRESEKDGEKIWEGSARGYEKTGFTGFREFLLNSGLVLYAEGHSNAFGVGVTAENFDKLVEYIDIELADMSLDIRYDVDFIFDANRLTKEDIFELADYSEIWGQKIDEPLIAIENLKITANNLKFMGGNGKTLGITLPKDNISMVKFNLTDEEKEALDAGMGTYNMTIIGYFQKNIWNGFIKPQIAIKDYEINEKIEYYF